MAGTVNCAGESEVKAHEESETHEYPVVRVTGQMCAGSLEVPEGSQPNLIRI